MRNKEELLEYAYENKRKIINSFDDIDDGIESFNCLIYLIEDGTITDKNIDEYI